MRALHTTVKESMKWMKGIVKWVADIKQEKIPKWLEQAAKSARGLSGVVKESVGPGLSKVSEELPGTIRATPGAIRGAADGAKVTAMSYWEWVKKKVEGRGK